MKGCDMARGAKKGRRVYKEVETEYGPITIWGSNRPIRIGYATPEWGEYGEKEPCFQYKNRRRYLSEFPRPGAGGGYVPEWLREFDGYERETFFSGVAIKLVKDDFGCEAVKAFTVCA